MDDSDAFSRSSTEKPTTRDINIEQDVIAHVCATITNMPATNAKLTEIKQETRYLTITQSNNGTRMA